MAHVRRVGRAPSRGAALNKKILCFVDECGTAGAGDWYLGAVLVHARETARIDKIFSDRLAPNAGEIHASQLGDRYLKGLMQRVWGALPQHRVVLINQKCPARPVEGPVLYAEAVVETVKVGLKRFKQDVLKRETIGNVELILDANHQNEHPLFDARMAASQTQDGRFQGVKRIVRVDSAACRLLQLADLTAYARKWIVRESETPESLRERFGIQLS